MSKIAKQFLRDYINEQSSSNTDDILNATKEMFKDVPQEVLEAEMDSHLGYDKNDLSEKDATNRRNEYSSKTAKSELDPVKINIPRDRYGIAIKLRDT